MMKKEILDEITKQYLTSRDYNGLHTVTISKNHRISLDELSHILMNIVEEDLIDLRFGDFHPNIFIKALDEYPKSELLKIISAEKLNNCCAYPSKKHLVTVVDPKEYEGKPFELALALGENQLAWRAFDLSILEFYRNDPRYYYHNSDISGSIYYSEDAQAEGHNPDDVYLQDFGFCYNSKKERAIAVYLRRLSTLSSEHQQLWNSRIIKGDYKLHPDFYRASILGHFPEGVSVYRAFLIEQEKINILCDWLHYPPLFKNIYSDRDRPKEFGILLRPTLREFNNFILVLDKLISENFNLAFFNNLDLEREETRKDGKIIVRQKGTIELFEEWIRTNFKPKNPETYDKIIKPLRKVRRMRQEPAHAIKEDVFDQKYIHSQRKIMIDVYESVHIFRLILGSHPYLNPESVKELEDDFKIWLE